MPYLGRTSFLRRRKLCQFFSEKDVSMPYLGRTSFLPYDGISKDCHSSGVNALSRAHFISTESLKRDTDIVDVCQCPISGALHFYI